MNIFKPIDFSKEINFWEGYLEVEILKKKIKRDTFQEKLKQLQERIKKANSENEHELQEFLEEYLEEQKIIYNQ